jgi:hypothetical protein
MKKLIIGLLIVAAAGTAFYLLTRKKKDSQTATISKELIMGKWKTVVQEPAADSAKTLYQYEFQKDGILLRAAGDSAKADTAHYEWNKSNELVWKEKAADSIGRTYTVIKLTADSLELKTGQPAASMVLTKLN